MAEDDGDIEAELALGDEAEVEIEADEPAAATATPAVERKEDKRTSSATSEKKSTTTRSATTTGGAATSAVGGTPVRSGASGNLASVDDGAAVIMATSSDPRHPPAAIIDGDDRTFWMTTGMFPQEFVVSFPRPIIVSRTKIICKNVASLQVLRCETSEPRIFEEIYHSELADRSGKQEDIQLVENVQAHYLKFVIRTGRDDFAAVYRLDVEGKVR